MWERGRGIRLEWRDVERKEGVSGLEVEDGSVEFSDGMEGQYDLLGRGGVGWWWGDVV